MTLFGYRELMFCSLLLVMVTGMTDFVANNGRRSLLVSSYNIRTLLSCSSLDTIVTCAYVRLTCCAGIYVYTTAVLEFLSTSLLRLYMPRNETLREQSPWVPMGVFTVDGALL